MADNTPANKVAGIKQAWADPKARKGMLLAGGILVIVGIVAMSMINKTQVASQTPSSASVVAPPHGQRDVTADSPEKYKKLVAESDNERAENARATNPTAVVMPTLAGFTSDQEAKKREDEAKAAAERGRLAALEQGQTAQQQQFRTAAQAAGVSNGQQGPTPQDMARNTPEYKVTQAFLTKVAAEMSVSSMVPIYAPRVAAAEGAAAAAGAPGAAAAGGAAAQATGKLATPMVRMGEIAFGTTDIALSTDYSGPVSATVRQGKLNGVRLMGQKQLEQGAVVIRFTMMSPADGGPAVPINAYAVSLGDAKQFGLTGIEGSTDYHIFQRYVLPAAAAFVQTWGTTAAMKGTTTTVTNSAVGTSTPGLDNSDRMAVAAGAAMAPIVADLTKQAQRPITVSLPAMFEIGVMFAADVMPNGTLGAGVSVPTTPAVAAPTGPVPQAYQQQPTQVGYGVNGVIQPGLTTYGAGVTYPGQINRGY